MRRSLALLAAGALALGACSGGDDVIVTSSPTASSSNVETGGLDADPSPAPSGSPSASPSPSSTPEPSTSPTEVDEPADEELSEAQRLDRISPSEAAIGLVVVDPLTGAVSWFDGFGFATFDVDAALDATSWAMDGAGGLLLQSSSRAIWHLPEPSDEPELLMSGPGEDWMINQNLVGGGLIDGRPHAFVESGTVDQPETTSSDLVSVDIATGEVELVEPTVTGWESAIGDASLVGVHLLMTYYAESFGGVTWQNQRTGAQRLLGEGELIEIHSTLDPAPRGVPNAYMLMEEDDFSGWTLVTRALEGDAFDVSHLPDHPQRYRDVAVFDEFVLASGDELTLVRTDSFSPWRVLDVSLSGYVVLAPGLPLG